MVWERWSKQIKWGVTAFLVLLIASIMVLFIYHFGVFFNFLKGLIDILLPIIYGAVMAYIMAPFYDKAARFIKRRLVSFFYLLRHSRHLESFPIFKSLPSMKLAGWLSSAGGVALAVLIILLTASGLISMIIPELIRSTSNLIDSMPVLIDRLYVLLSDLSEHNSLAENLFSGLLEEIDKLRKSGAQVDVIPGIGGIVSSVREYLSMDQGLMSMLSSGISYASSWIWSVMIWAKNIFIGLIVMAYLLAMKKKLMRQGKKLLFAIVPYNISSAILRECNHINVIFGGFIVGKLVDSLIIGILCFIVLSIMQMPYTMLVSVIVGITNVIPFFGPFIGAVPSFLLIFLVNPIKGLYFLGAILVIQQLDGNVIGPKILGDSTGLSSFWVLFSIVLFGGLFGFVGMVIGVPTWAVIYDAFRRFATNRLRVKNIKSDLDLQIYEEEGEKGLEANKEE